MLYQEVSLNKIFIFFFFIILYYCLFHFLNNNNKNNSIQHIYNKDNLIEYYSYLENHFKKNNIFPIIKCNLIMELYYQINLNEIGLSDWMFRRYSIYKSLFFFYDKIYLRNDYTIDINNFCISVIISFKSKQGWRTEETIIFSQKFFKKLSNKDVYEILFLIETKFSEIHETYNIESYDQIIIKFI